MHPSSGRRPSWATEALSKTAKTGSAFTKCENYVIIAKSRDMRRMSVELIFGALICAVERWRNLPLTEFELRQLFAIVRKELDDDIKLRSRRRWVIPTPCFPANPRI